LKADLPKHGLSSGELATVMKLDPSCPGEDARYSLKVISCSLCGL
jgi:hypothetical protein